MDGKANDTIEILAAAYGTVEAAFEQCAKAVIAPLEAISGIFWDAAVQRTEGTGAQIKVVDFQTLQSTSTGQTFYIPAEQTNQLADPQPRPTDTVAYDAWLSAHGVAVSRVAADPIPIRMDAALWAASATRRQAILEAIEARFDQLMGSLRAATPVNGTVVVAEVKMTFSSDSSAQGQGRLDLYCYAGVETLLVMPNGRPITP